MHLLKKMSNQNETPLSIQERTKNKINEILGEIDIHFDEYISTWREIKLYRILYDCGVKRGHTKEIIEYSNKMIKEYQNAIDGVDEQIVEGYSNFSKPQLRKIIRWWETIIESCNRIAEEAKTIRKYNTARNKKLREAGLLDKNKSV